MNIIGHHSWKYSIYLLAIYLHFKFTLTVFIMEVIVTDLTTPSFLLIMQEIAKKKKRELRATKSMICTTRS